MVMHIPVVAIGLGTLAAYVTAPDKSRVLVASIFFGIVIFAVTATTIQAIFTHSVRTLHWFLLLWVCVAWFLNRNLFRSATPASGA
jgi:hypothetical protein